jgi:hypothetical protein
MRARPTSHPPHDLIGGDATCVCRTHGPTTARARRGAYGPTADEGRSDGPNAYAICLALRASAEMGA